MKTFTIAACVFGLVATGVAQDRSQQKMQKEINIEMSDDGEKTMTITTIVDGEKKVEVLKGEEVDAYLEKEHQHSSHHSSSGHGVQKMVFITEDGETETIEIDIDKILEEEGIWIDEHGGEQHIVIKECHKKGDENLDYAYEYKIAHTEMEEAMREMHEAEGERVMIMKQIQAGENTKVIHDEEVFEDVEDIEKLMKELGIEYDCENGKAKKISVQKIVIIEEEEQEQSTERMTSMNDEMKFYPNPSTGQFTLEFSTPTNKKAKVSVIDVNGKEIFSKTVKGQENYTFPIDISDESKGVYVVKIQQGDIVKARKIMIE